MVKLLGLRRIYEKHIPLDNQVPFAKKIEEQDDSGRELDQDLYDQKTQFPWYLDFFQKLLLLVIGFVLTYWVGNYLTDRFRRETARTEIEIAAMQSDITRAVQVFENISSLMDRRLYRMRRLHDIFAGHVGNDVFDERLREYRTALIEWNDNLNRYRALFSFYFSREAQGELSGVATSQCPNTFEAVAADFANAHRELQMLIDKKSDGSLEETQSRLNNLNECVYLLDELMLYRIQELRAAYKQKIAAH